MDKKIFNWRNCVKRAIFIVGLASLLAAFADPDDSITTGEHLKHVAKYMFIALLSFGTLRTIVSK